jgi:putative membrane protein
MPGPSSAIAAPPARRGILAPAAEPGRADAPTDTSHPIRSPSAGGQPIPVLAAALSDPLPPPLPEARLSARRLGSAFSAEDLASVEAAVRDVESRSPGEVVPYAVDHSDSYPEAAWAAATAGALLAALVAAVPLGLVEGSALWIAGLPALGAALGYVLGALCPPLRVRLVHAEVIEHRVRQRAAAAFVEQEVFRTAARTGILVFLSLLERRVVVLGDAGINARVSQHEWDAIVAGIVAGMRDGRPGAALAAAIRLCGDLLVAHHFERGPDDRDELPDDLRRRPE